MHYLLPKLKNEHDFEELVRDLYRIRYKNPNLQLYGRKGQKQHGIDIIGVAGKDRATDKDGVIQCKNHTANISDAKLCSEIDDELAAFDKSSFKGGAFTFATSAFSSAPVQDHVIKINASRSRNKQNSVSLIFWEEISQETVSNQALLHKYYGDQLSVAPPVKFIVPDAGGTTRTTHMVKLSDLEDQTKTPMLLTDLKATCLANIGNIRKTDPYNLYLGISTHSDVNFNSRVDLHVDASEFFSDMDDLDIKYKHIVAGLVSLSSVLGDPFFSKRIVITSDIESNLALMVGKVFRKHRFEIDILFKEVYLTSKKDELAYYPSLIDETFLLTQTSVDVVPEDLVFVVNMALRTDITKDVMGYAKTYIPNAVFRFYGLSNGNAVVHSAHASSIAEDIGAKLHNFQGLGLKRIHIFMATPKPLAMLIGHKINTLNTELHLYFRSSDRSTYLKTGVLKNNTF